VTGARSRQPAADQPPAEPGPARAVGHLRSAPAPSTVDRSAGGRPGPPAPPRAPALQRWLPLLAALGYVAAVLLAADTPPADLLRYAAYVSLALILPGTLVYRSLRRTPHTLVEDVAMGAAVGLVLELPAWALASALDVRGWLWAWPLLVVVPFLAVPRLRRHWLVRGYPAVPLGWSWTVAGAVAFFTTYLSSTFLERNPILPTDEGTRQYLDLAYQLSLAGEAKGHFPLHVPQVADEPLYYHWFGYAHMAATSLVGGIDLPVVALRLAVPALCAAAIVLTAVVGWRVSGKPYAGAVAAVLFFVVGEVNFTHPVSMPFGTQASFVVWHGMSMIYSWVLLLALIGVLADLVDRRPDGVRPTAALGRGGFALAALLLLGSGGAKASSLPVTGAALLVAAAAALVAGRRVPWRIAALGLMTAVAQLFAIAVLFDFQSYGVTPDPFWSFERYWSPAPPVGPSLLGAVAVVVAFLVNMQLRGAGILPLAWRSRLRLDPAQWFLLGGAVAGPVIYLAIKQPGDGNQYFTRTGFAFAVLLSGWGYVRVFERARLSRAGTAALGAASGAFAIALVAIQFRFAGGPEPSNPPDPLDPLMPLLRWSMLLVAFGSGVAALWIAAGRWLPALRGRGALVALTAVLLAGAPGLLMDMKKSREYANGGAYATVPMPRSRVLAARWVRDHSRPGDVLATNAHCLTLEKGICDPRSFWLSAYSERRVLVEGWAFAPRVSASGSWAFWEPDLLRQGDEAFTAPTRAGLARLRDRDGVRWLVADRQVLVESPALGRLAKLAYENDRIAVYELG
jgi:hypothetical protein